jgi:hypothetical protein
LFRQYKDWLEKITNDELGNAKYFISQLGYEALPEEMIDQTIIEEARDGGQSNASFQREYCAQFTDGSDSYFSARKMHECTIPDGEEPTTKIKGEAGSNYVLAIDPSFSNSPSSDYFAMSVIEIDDETEDAILVHSYAVAGGDLKNHIKYMYYLVTHFNFEMIIIDNAGYQFIDSCNESDLFTKNRINLKLFDFDSDKEGIDYKKMLVEAKRQYNKEDGKIVFKQNFTTKFIRTANEHLQACIDHKRIWFASKTTANDVAFTKEINKHISLKNTPNESVLDLIEMQDAWIYQTKKQCALVEVKSTAKGTQTFDLPQHLKRSTSPGRARKDNYTTLMLACWAAKCYYDIVKLRVESKHPTFSPIMIR